MQGAMPPAGRAIDRRRKDLLGIDESIHLLSHSLGPVPKAARDSLLDYLRCWERHAVEDAWESTWWDLWREAGDRIARIIGAAPGTVLPQPNTSIALATVASCLDYGAGRRRIVTTALDFPTTAYVWEAQRAHGAAIHVVPSDDGLTIPTERILDAIDGDTLLVALSHVSYLSSHRIEPASVVARAREAGAMVLLDVYQSAGVIEIGADGLGADFLVGGMIKWLCGGPACGYLHVRPDRIPALEPRLTGWFAHSDPFAFEPGPIRYDDSIRRFAQGTTGIPGLYSCLPGLRLVEEVGLPVIEEESVRRTGWMIDFALERGWRVNTPRQPERRGGCVMIGVDRPREAAARLRERGVLVDWRPGVGIRMSPHFFNTDDEVERAMGILSELIG